MNEKTTYTITDNDDEWKDFFGDAPKIAKCLLGNAKESLRKIETILGSVPQFIDALKKNIPEGAFQAILSDEQREQLADGTLKLMHKKDGSILAELIDPKSKQMVAHVPLKYVENPPKELTNELTNFAVQMQLAQIAEQVQELQLAVEEVLQGQESDRLATAYSCQQKFLQAQKIENPELKQQALLQVALAAEDSRNLLMQSQISNLKFIIKQPENFWGRFFRGAKPEKIDRVMIQIRESLVAINSVSITEALAYQEMGEYKSARQGLLYYSDYLRDTYLSVDGLVDKLDLIDPATDNFWSVALPNINAEIKALPCANEEVE